MNTKIFLLFLVLHIVPVSVSSVISEPKQADKMEIAAIKKECTIAVPHNANAFPWELALHNFHYKGQDHNSDEDGKTHHIHFERLINHRWKLFLCLMGKMILLITYLCSLTSFYAHYLHI